MQNKLFQTLLIAAILSPSIVLGQPICPPDATCYGPGINSLKAEYGCTSNQCLYGPPNGLICCNPPSKESLLLSQ
jgi:hypothetical protein